MSASSSRPEQGRASSAPASGPQSAASATGTPAPGARGGRGGLRETVKGPLVFSAVLGAIGGVIAAVTASGGTHNPLRVDIGLIAFGVFFIVSLVVVAMLQLSARENPEHLSQGSGTHRSSEETHRRAVAERRARERAAQQEAEQRDPDAPTTHDRTDGGDHADSGRAGDRA